MSASLIETPPRSYSPVSIGLHWLMLALLAAVYAVIFLRQEFPRGSDIRTALKALHFSLGLSVFVLVWVRLAARRWGGGPLTAHGWDGRIAAVMHIGLYAFMIVMPILGWLLLSAEGDPIRLFGLPLPALIGPDEAQAERLGEIHETLGIAGLFVVGLHAVAALFHHYVLHDGVLGRMLRWRR